MRSRTWSSRRGAPGAGWLRDWVSEVLYITTVSETRQSRASRAVGLGRWWWLEAAGRGSGRGERGPG